MNDVWYRFEDRLVSAGVDEFDNPLGPAQLHVVAKELRVISYTPKGVWLQVYSGKRFVLRDARKRYACPTPDEAFESYKGRKERQFEIYQRKADNAVRAIRQARMLMPRSSKHRDPPELKGKLF